MDREKSLSYLSGSFISLCFTIFLQQTCIAQKQQACVPSSCGKITNIRHPFRLTHDPPNCGNRSYELNCENDIAVLYLYSARYYVESINYNNFTIRLVDPGVQRTDCSSIPRYFLYRSNFSDGYPYDEVDAYAYDSLFEHVIYLNCSNGVSRHDYPDYVDTASCINWNSTGHIYAVLGDLWTPRLKVYCPVMKVAATSLYLRDENFSYDKNISYTDIHRALVFGFDLSWLNAVCRDYCGSMKCYTYGNGEKVACYPYCYTPLGIEHNCDDLKNFSKLRIFVEEYIVGAFEGLLKIAARDHDPEDVFYNPPYNVTDLAFVLGVVTGRYIPPYVTARFLFGVIILFLFLIYTLRRRHNSIYGNIEDFLQENNLMPIRYSYNEIKKMTRGFKDKLGEGGFGSVYKGKLRSGPFVAVKMLGKANTNGQDFISEVATIGRIHNVNVVQLVGFCFEGKKRALVYDFMVNGSLDKYIFSEKDNILLSYEKMYEISL